VSTPVNEAYLEHLARGAVADLFFTDDDMGEVGWRTDRGVILSRYGEAPIVATFAPTSDADARDAVGRVITVWYYPRSNLEFVFTGPPAMNSALFAGNHRGFAEQQREETPLLLDNVPLLRDLDTIGVQLARFRASDSSSTLLVAAALPTQRLYANAELDGSALEVSLWRTTRRAWDALARDTVTVRLPAAARAPLTRWWTTTLVAERRREAPSERLRVEARDESAAAAVGRAQVALPAALAARDARTGTRAVSDLLIADRLSTRATLPSTSLRWHDVDIVPRGDLQVAQRDTFAVYWELYDLPRQRDLSGDGVTLRYNVHLTVTLEAIDRGPNMVARFLGGVTDLVGLSPEGDEQLGVRFAREVTASSADVTRPEPRVADGFTLGLGDALPGRYRLDVRITDRASNTTLVLTRLLYVRRGQ
jgi:hypothetical protein